MINVYLKRAVDYKINEQNMHVVRRMIYTGHFFGTELTLQNNGIKRTK